MIKTVTYNDVEITSIGGIVLSVSPPIRAQRRIESVEVPGRNGVLHIDDNSYTPVTKTIRIGVSTPDVRDAINAWCAQSGILTTSFEPNRAYKVTQIAEVIWERVSNRLSQCIIVFECDPFRYVYPEPGAVVFTSAGNISNPGSIYSAPAITVTGSGNVVLTIGNQTVGLNNISLPVTIDSDMQTAFTQEEAVTANMSGDFPLLQPGISNVAWTGNVTKLSILPRWRYL